MIGLARWRKSFLRESGASFFILVQIQAGPPAFAALRQLRLGKPFARPLQFGSASLSGRLLEGLAAP